MIGFRKERVSGHIIRIIDAAGVAMYLVVGKTRACLIDTGCGFSNLHQYVLTITDKPVFVILTHGHIDHVSGTGGFREIYIHDADKEIGKIHTSLEFRKEFFKEYPQMLVLGKYVVPDMNSFLSLHDGQIFDLGNIILKAIHVPGHTLGMMMILIVEEETIIYGDGCGVSVMIYGDESTSVAEYKESLLRLKYYNNGNYHRILRNHGSFESSMDLLEEVLLCCEEILSGIDDKIPTKVFGEGGFYLAKPVDSSGNRLDKKEGNIIYRWDKC